MLKTSASKKPSKKRTEHNVQLAVPQPGADPLSFLDQTTSLLTQFVPPDHGYWAGLAPEDREKEISALWHKDQLEALKVVAPAMLQFEYACNILPVYAPMIREIREQAKINARPTAGQKQYMWKDIGVDREGPITWTTICEVIFRRCIQHINRLIADTKKIMPLLTDGNQNDDGTVKSGEATTSGHAYNNPKDGPRAPISSAVLEVGTTVKVNGKMLTVSRKPTMTTHHGELDTDEARVNLVVRPAAGLDDAAGGSSDDRKNRAYVGIHSQELSSVSAVGTAKRPRRMSKRMMNAMTEARKRRLITWDEKRVHPLGLVRPSRFNSKFHCTGKVPALVVSKGWVYGWWSLYAASKMGTKGRLHGSYPRQFLPRALSLFPGAKDILHVPSGTLGNLPAGHVTMDMKSDDTRKPMVVGDCCEEIPFPDGSFDLILSDPPYSPADSELYGCPPFRTMAFFREAHRVLRPGGYLGFLHLHLPQVRKPDDKKWRMRGVITITLGSHKKARAFSLWQRI
jgi:hypothetical protein